LIAPGALDKTETAFFGITPVGDDWPSEQKESFLRENNFHMLRILCIHEAIPGHYLQLDLANKCASVVRAILTNAPFAEGWAVWATAHIIDNGFDKDDISTQLQHWKMWLRMCANVIMDVGIALFNMNRDEAMKLMCEATFQEQGEAAAKWVRAQLTSTQLCYYFFGYLAVTDIVAEARQREGDKFSIRRFIDKLLSFGTPSVRVLQQAIQSDSRS